MAKIVFMDLETTGFSREWDYIIEVAAILYDEETQKTLGQFPCILDQVKDFTTKNYRN